MLNLRKKKLETDAEVARLAKSFLAEYSRTEVLLRSFGKIASGNEKLANIYKKLRMTREIPGEYLEVFHNKNMKEFVDIVASGVERGAETSKAVELFVKRLTREIEIKNKIKAKTGGAQTLIYMGMGFFFPLFSGISAIIISSSLGMLNQGTFVIYRGFLIIALAYVPIILYLSSAFANPEKNPIQNLVSIVPYCLLAATIVLSTQVYLANVV